MKKSQDVNSPTLNEFIRKVPIDSSDVFEAIEDILIEKSGHENKEPKEIIRETMQVSIEFVLWLLAGKVGKGRAIPKNSVIEEALLKVIDGFEEETLRTISEIRKDLEA